MTAKRRPSNPSAQAAALSILGIVLVWQIITHSVAAVLAGIEPRWALALAPGNSEASLRLADRMLGQNPSHDQDVSPEKDGSASLARTPSAALQERITRIATRGFSAPMVSPDRSPEEQETIRALATTAWLANPLDARAPRILGQLAETDAATRPLMQRSRMLSLHETLANYWLFQDAFLQSNQAGTLGFADIMLRVQPEIARLVVPVLAHVAETPAGAVSLKTLLRSDPPWRRLFFETLPFGVSNFRTPLDLLLDLRATRRPPTQAETSPYLGLLMQRKSYALAHEAWLRLLPDDRNAALGPPFNGSFDAEPSAMPFDWRFLFDGGVRAELAVAPDEPARTALKLEFLDQYIPTFAITQTIVLTPGAYVFTGSESGIFDARHGLLWTVACTDQPYTPFAKSERLHGASGWKAFAFTFNVPAEHCEAQQLSLGIDAVSESEKILSGTAWFTDLAIRPKR